MTRTIIGAIILGILIGIGFVPESALPVVGEITGIILILFIFSIGIDLGINKYIFKDIFRNDIIIFLIPLMTIIGSLLGGLICGLIFEIPANKSLSIASGFGWYSLSGAILTNIDGPEIGTIAFLSNIFRELFSVVAIPFIAKIMNKYTAIAPAGATSMDTTLPIIVEVTSKDMALYAIFNGALLSFLVPYFVPFFYYL